MKELNSNFLTPEQAAKIVEIAILEAEIEKPLILSEEKVLELIERHPHVKDLKDFDGMRKLALGYTRYKRMEVDGTLPDISQNELARQLGISSSRISEYKNKNSYPKLLKILIVHESARRAHESSYTSEALEHRIEPELVHEKLSHIRGLEHNHLRDIATALREVYENTNSSSKVRWIDLRPYAPVGQEWCRTVYNLVEEFHDVLEREMNKQLALDNQRLRLGVIDSKIFFRSQETSEPNLMNLYNDEMFHFHEFGTRERLLSEAKDRLGLKGDINLSRLAHQVTDYNKALTQQGMNTDLHYSSSYLKGSTLSLLLDACDLKVQDIQSEISFIGRSDRHGVRNPRFSDDSLEIDKAFARLFGGGLSDGHIDQHRVFCYCDANRERADIFKGHFVFFGDVDYTEKVDENGTIDIRFPSVIGRMLEKRGFTVGDKTVQNNGIPEFILNGDIEVVIEYLRQLWAEDGHFIFGEGQHTYFAWTRAVSLLDPQKDAKYGIDYGITDEMVQFIRDHGEYIEYFNGKYHPRYVLSGGKLRNLEESKNPLIATKAHAFSTLLNRNKPVLMITEQGLLSRINAESIPTCTELFHYIGTGRVSALWRARTQSLDDAMRVAILAPPDDEIKKQHVRSWIKSESSRYRGILYELNERGIQMSLEEY